MSEKPDAPHKFNILDALNKEIGKQEKKLRSSQAKRDSKDTAKDSPHAHSASGPKDTQHAPHGANGDAAGESEATADQASVSPPPGDLIRSLAALRDWLENELLSDRGAVLDTLGNIVDAYAHEQHVKWPRHLRLIVTMLLIVVVSLLVGDAVAFYGIYHSFPAWMPSFNTGR